MTHSTDMSKAPDFQLTTVTGEKFKLSDQAGHKVILYFYPAAMTPACTTENQEFSQNATRFAQGNIQLVGISPDTCEKLEKFKTKYDLTPTLLSDPDYVVATLYGAYGEKKNYGRIYQGIIRSTFLVDENGILVKEWRNIRAKGHIERVLKELSL